MDEYARWDVRGPYHPFILQQMFIHVTESGWKEAERLICCGCQQGLPKLDSGVDIHNVQLVGHQMSSKEIVDLYCQCMHLGDCPEPHRVDQKEHER